MVRLNIKFVMALWIVSLIAAYDPSQAGSKPFKLGLDYLANRITSDMGQHRKQYVAVPDFTDLDGRVSELGMFISEELLTRLHDTQKVKVVERRLLNKVIEEHQLGLTGLIDPKTVKRLGKILGADSLCTGTITDLRSTLMINARMIDVETGQVFAVASAEVDKSDALRILMRKYTRARRLAESKREKKHLEPGYNLVVNGDFTHRYTGWKREVGDIRQGNSRNEIIGFSEGKSGKALHIQHRGKGHIQFRQMVRVPTADLIFSATFQAGSREGSIKAFSGTGVVQIALQYLDRKGSKIGQTVLLNYVKNPFADTPLIGVPRRTADTYKCRYIKFSGDRLYHDYKIDVRQEIEDNLLGVDPDSIEEIAVLLWCGATHSQARSQLWVTDIALKIK